MARSLDSKCLTARHATLPANVINIYMI